MPSLRRTHTCGELRASHVGQAVVLNGWVNTVRTYNDQVFIDLRDRYGITQVVFEPDNKALLATAQELRSEFVVAVRGKVAQRLAGKTFDTFAPVGPYLVTADEIPDPHALGIRLRLNGETMQDSNTRQLIFPTPEVVAYLSQVFTLEPGDLIFTGTPPGVGFARKPPVYLKDGDVVEVEIDGLGVLRNPVVAERG